MSRRIVLRRVRDENSRRKRMIWEWRVPSLKLGGYCARKSEARTDARLCIAVQANKAERLNDWEDKAKNWEDI